LFDSMFFVRTNLILKFGLWYNSRKNGTEKNDVPANALLNIYTSRSIKFQKSYLFYGTGLAKQVNTEAMAIKYDSRN